jgi:hypothetical protein
MGRPLRREELNGSEVYSLCTDRTETPLLAVALLQRDVAVAADRLENTASSGCSVVAT